MYSEELRLQMYYELERSWRRRERRALAGEDLHSSQLRGAERREREREERARQREERAKEGAEIRWLAREDEAGQRLRCLERERCELLLMMAADAEGAMLRE